MFDLNREWHESPTVSRIAFNENHSGRKLEYAVKAQPADNMGKVTGRGTAGARWDDNKGQFRARDLPPSSFAIGNKAATKWTGSIRRDAWSRWISFNNLGSRLKTPNLNWFPRKLNPRAGFITDIMIHLKRSYWLIKHCFTHHAICICARSLVCPNHPRGLNQHDHCSLATGSFCNLCCDYCCFALTAPWMAANWVLTLTGLFNFCKS